MDFEILLLLGCCSAVTIVGASPPHGTLLLVDGVVDAAVGGAQETRPFLVQLLCFLGDEVHRHIGGIDGFARNLAVLLSR